MELALLKKHFITRCLKQGSLVLFLFYMLSVTIVNADTKSSGTGAEIVYPPYEEQKAVFDFYFDHPAKIAGGLYWLLGMFHTLNEEPYGIAPDFLDVKVILHGTEIVTLAKSNYTVLNSI